MWLKEQEKGNLVYALVFRIQFSNLLDLVRQIDLDISVREQGNEWAKGWC